MLSFLGVHIGFYEWGGADFDCEGGQISMGKYKSKHTILK